MDIYQTVATCNVLSMLFYSNSKRLGEASTATSFLQKGALNPELFASRAHTVFTRHFHLCGDGPAGACEKQTGLLGVGRC